MAGIDELPYRDPRTAYGGAATAKRPQIPVGTATPATMGQFQAAQAAAPAPGIGAMPAPPQAATIPAAPATPTPAKTGIGSKMGAFGPAATAALVGAPEALKVGQVLADPKSTGIDVATQAAEGTGRAAATTAGAIGGAKLGSMAAPFLGPFAPAGPVIGSIGGGIAGYYSANKAIEGGRAAVGADTQSPVDRVPAPAGIGALRTGQVPLPAGVAPSTAGAGRGGTTVMQMSPQAIKEWDATRGNPGAVSFDPKSKSFSGTDVREGFDYAGGVRPTGLTPEQGGGGLKGGGTVTTLDMSEGRRQDQMALQRAAESGTQAEPQSGMSMSGIGSDPAKSERNVNFDRDTVLSRLESASRLGGSVRERIEAMKALAVMSSQPTPFDIQQAQERQADIARRAQDIGSINQQAGNRTQRDIATMQGRTARDVANISSEGRIAAVEARGAQPNKFTTVLLPDQIDPATGQVIRGGQAIVNSQTNEVTYPGQGTGAKPAAPPAGAIQKLRSDPKLAADFDAKYGKGAAAAVLGQ